MLAVKDTLYEVLTPLMENVKKKYEERVENVKKDKNVLNLKRSEKLKNKRLKELKADFDNAYITPEKFIKILKGEMGDAHWANSMLEGYMYNQDPVVASLARYVKDHYSEMLTKIQQISNDFAKDMEADIKRSSVNVNPAAIGNQVLFEDTVIRTDQETGEAVERKIWTILNPFIGNRKAHGEHIAKIKKAKEVAYETGDYTQLVDATNKFRLFKNDYYWRPYAQIFYDRQKNI